VLSGRVLLILVNFKIFIKLSTFEGARGITPNVLRIKDVAGNLGEA